MGIYKNLALELGPAAYWRFQEASGVVFADSSGNSHTATGVAPLTGITYGVAGVPSSGIATTKLFNSTGDRPEFTPITMTGQRTITFWVTIPTDFDDAQYAGVISPPLADGSDDGLWIVRDSSLFGDTQIRPLLGFTSPNFTGNYGPINLAPTLPVLTPNTPSMVTVTYNTATHTIRWYRNGVLTNTNVIDGSVDPFEAFTSMSHYGRLLDDYAGDAMYASWFTELAVYARELSAAEISMLYRAGRSTYVSTSFNIWRAQRAYTSALVRSRLRTFYNSTEPVTSLLAKFLRNE